MKKIINSIITLTALASLFLTGCGSAPKSSDGRLNALTSTTFLADITRNIAGDHISVDFYSLLEQIHTPIKPRHLM